jgi:hypothetical protein
MSSVVIDDALRARLKGLTEPTAFYDESGRVLGHFVPAAQSAFMPSPSDGCPYSAEELERFRAETGGASLAEVWKRLGQS